MKKTFKEKYCVEYSVSQNCFNIDMLKYIIDNNINNAISHGKADYNIIAIEDSYQMCKRFINKFKKQYSIIKK